MAGSKLSGTTSVRCTVRHSYWMIACEMSGALTFVPGTAVRPVTASLSCPRPDSRPQMSTRVREFGRHDVDGEVAVLGHQIVGVA
jgi:hypothetical protein